MGIQSSNTGVRVTEESPGSSANRSRTLSLIGMAVFLAFFVLAVYVFVLIQLVPPGDAWLSSAIPLRGHYGVDQALPGVSYTELLEFGGLISFIGLFIYSYGKVESPSIGRRAMASLSLPLKVFGLVIAVIVYTETHLLWGELWYGAKLVAVNPQGFPWGNERVASNLCFLHGSDYIPSYGSYCWFLNYDELLFIALGMVLLGWLISRSFDSRDNASGS